MTLTLSPSMMATQEFVVPRSMPMIFPMIMILRNMWLGRRARLLPRQWGRDPVSFKIENLF